MISLLLRVVWAVCVAAIYLLLALKVLSKFVSPIRSRSSALARTVPSPSQVSVTVLTWNIAGAAPSDEAIRAFLKPSFEANADVVVVGLQEVGSAADLRQLPSRVTLVLNQLSSPSAFQLLEFSPSSVRESVLMCVFVRASLADAVDDLQSGIESFGLPVIQQKGAVGFAFRLFSTRFLFMNLHLEPHKPRLFQRNVCLTRAIEHLRFYDESAPAFEQFDVFVAFGDLNYRLDTRASTDEIVRQLKSIQTTNTSISNNSNSSNEHSRLVSECDQLSRELRRGEGVMKRIREVGEVHFSPTYKFKTHSSEYDTRRTPAWCDRILLVSTGCLSQKEKEKKASGIETLQYRSIDDETVFGSSDHRPVFAALRVPTRLIGE